MWRKAIIKIMQCGRDERSYARRNLNIGLQQQCDVNREISVPSILKNQEHNQVSQHIVCIWRGSTTKM